MRSGDRFETPDFARVVGSRLDATKLDSDLIQEAFVRFGARGIRRLEVLTNLRSLDLRNSKVSDFSPLRALTNLQSLDLEGTQVSDFSPLQALTNLQLLDLQNTHARWISLTRDQTGSLPATSPVPAEGALENLNR